MNTIVCHRIDNKAHFKVFFNFDKDLINKIKELPKNKRIWDGDEKCWHLSTRGLYDLMVQFKGNGQYFFQMNDLDKTYFREMAISFYQDDESENNEKNELVKRNRQILKLKETVENDYKKYEKDILVNLRDGVKLYPHQVGSVMYLGIAKNALLALHMGLGKTLVSIAHFEKEKYNKIFVVTPNSLKYNYADEVEKFTYSKHYILGSKNNKYTIEESKYVISHYDYYRDSDHKKVLAKLIKDGIDLKQFDAICFDESQKLKNSTANTTKNLKKIIKKIKSKSLVFLSGTPMPNRTIELYNVLNLICPIEFPTKTDFYQYCGMKYNVYTGMWDIEIDVEKQNELFNKMQPYVYRKRKEDVLKDLPDKIYQDVHIELTDKERREYDDIQKAVIYDLEGNQYEGAIEQLAILGRLRKYLAMVKIPHITEIIKSVIESGEKIVVMDTYKEPLYELYKEFKDISVIHTGDQTVDERDVAKKLFQDPNSNILIFFASVQTANYGLTLTAASKIVTNTLPWSVGEFDQTTDRLHRIGQKNTVFVYMPIVKDSLDEHVSDLLNEKRTEIDRVIDNSDEKLKKQSFTIKDKLIDLLLNKKK